MINIRRQRTTSYADQWNFNTASNVEKKVRGILIGWYHAQVVSVDVIRINCREANRCNRHYEILRVREWGKPSRLKVFQIMSNSSESRLIEELELYDDDRDLREILKDVTGQYGGLRPKDV